MFLSTVRIYPAKAIISEFYIINRSFFGSVSFFFRSNYFTTFGSLENFETYYFSISQISTYLVTLIIVLEQFNVGRNTMKTESVQPTTYFPISTSS